MTPFSMPSCSGDGVVTGEPLVCRRNSAARRPPLASTVPLYAFEPRSSQCVAGSSHAPSTPWHLARLHPRLRH